MNRNPLTSFKQRPFLDRLPGDPDGCMKALFDFYRPQHLTAVLDHWLLLAIGTESESPYLCGAERAALLCFAHDLQALCLALYRMYIEPPAPAADRARVAFSCRAYPLRHSRAELWDLLDAVVSYAGPVGIEWGNILRDFEALSCLIEVAYLYQEAGPSKASAILATTA
jgi:hypothetical protein